MENYNERFLPIGSIVLMNGGKKKVMITGFLAKSKEHGNRVFDYLGCLYPEGCISSSMTLLFDHKDIKEVFSVGYTDEEYQSFKEMLNKVASIALTDNTKNS